MIDNDSIHDILTIASQNHPLGGVGIGNGNYTAGQTYSIDTIPPTVTSITRTGSIVPTTGSTVNFLVTFSEAVTGLNAADFTPTVTGLTGASVTGISGSGSTYTVSVNTGTGAGTVRLGLADGNSITDLAGNLLSGTFTAGQTYLVLAPNTDSLATVDLPALDLNLLGLQLQTTPITVNADAQQGNGNLLGNFLNSLLNTIDATPGNLTVLSQNLDALLAKVVGVLNASELVIPQATLDALPPVIQTLLSPVLISPAPGATTELLNLVIASPDGTPPVQADLLGLVVTTSNIDAQLWATTGDGQGLGNLLYNVANLLNQGNTSALLFLLTELALL